MEKKLNYNEFEFENIGEELSISIIGTKLNLDNSKTYLKQIVLTKESKEALILFLQIK